MTSAAHRFLSTARRKALRVRPVSKNPFASHLPVLAALGKEIKVRRVLELGSGPFSTALFLNRDVFPDLEELVSFEDDAEWSTVVQEAVGNDDRLDYCVVPAVSRAVPDDLSKFDLIFIDDSNEPRLRAHTIATVRDQRPSGVVAVHDCEQLLYRIQTRKFPNRYLFRTFTPQVGVCWSGDRLDAQRLQAIDKQIEAGRAIDFLDSTGWGSHLS